MKNQNIEKPIKIFKIKLISYFKSIKKEDGWFLLFFHLSSGSKRYPAPNSALTLCQGQAISPLRKVAHNCFSWVAILRIR